jgi:hypothetical protein
MVAFFRNQRNAKQTSHRYAFRCAIIVFSVVAFFLTCFAEASWRFVVTCDSRGLEGGVNLRVLDELVAEILSQDVDLVLFPGDLVYGTNAGSPQVFEQQLRTWVSVMKPVYDAGIPVYVGRGNHEVGDVYSAYADSPAEPDTVDNFALRWVNVFGSDLLPIQKLPGNGPPNERFMTYSVEHKNACILMLDQYAGMEHEFAHRVNQAWLDGKLASNTKPHIFAVGHEPAFAALHPDCLADHPADRDAFWAGIREAGARVYLCGHDHFYDHARVDDNDGDPNNDIHQYIIGTAGAVLYSWTPPYLGDNGDYTVEQIYHARQYGYVLVEVDETQVTLKWMGRSSNSLYAPGVYEPNDVWSYSVVARPILLSPNGGENLVAGKSYTVIWKTLDGAEIDYVALDYSYDDGRTWKNIDLCQNSGSYAWKVPPVDSKQCLLRISDLNDTKLSDVSDGSFTIFNCSREFAGDLNGDCYVDLMDLAILLQDWLTCANPLDPSCSMRE